jgi:hypothetical protein
MRIRVFLMRGVFWCGAAVNEAPEIRPDLKRGSHKRTAATPLPFLGEALYCVWWASIYNVKYEPEDLPDL